AQMIHRHRDVAPRRHLPGEAETVVAVVGQQVEVIAVQRAAGQAEQYALRLRPGRGEQLRGDLQGPLPRDWRADADAVTLVDRDRHHSFPRMAALRLADTSTCSAPATWLAAVPRIWRTPSSTLLTPWM